MLVWIVEGGQEFIRLVGGTLVTFVSEQKSDLLNTFLVLGKIIQRNNSSPHVLFC